MGKEPRLLTERDFEGIRVPQNLFHSLVIAAQVANKIYITEKSQEKEHHHIENVQSATTQLSPQNDYLHEEQARGCSKGKKKGTIQYNFQDKRRSLKRKINEKSNILKGGNGEDTTSIYKEGFLIMSGMGVGSSSSQNSGVKVGNAKKKRKTNMLNAPVHQNLKPEFLNRIQNMGGTEIKLVIEKDLFNSDLAKVENRFTIPLNQVREDAQNFLNEDEKNTLEKRTKKNRVFTLDVPFIEPNLQMTVIKLKKWKMNNIYLYLLGGNWYEIGLRNELEEGNTMQVWSFRVQEQLHLALVNLSKDYKHDN